MYMYSIYSKYILYWSICSLVLQSYAIWNKVVNPLTTLKYIVLSVNFMFDLPNIFQEHNPGVE
jgi:hypothetical protein